MKNMKNQAQESEFSDDGINRELESNRGSESDQSRSEASRNPQTIQRLPTGNDTTWPLQFRSEKEQDVQRT